MVSAADTEVRGPVGWLIINPVEEVLKQRATAEEFVGVHLAMGLGLQRLRHDPAVRVVIITGRRDGEFHVAPRAELYDHESGLHDLLNPLQRDAAAETRAHNPRTGFPPAIETLALIEKPVVARVNGDAIGLGQSLLWGSDVIVAREDAVISDAHMGQGGVRDFRGVAHGFPWATPPGDGAMAFWPLFLPPTKAKEYMLLSRAVTAKELAAMNVVNYAVPLERLDETVDRIVGELLARPDQALAMTKRIANKALIQHWNLVADFAAAAQAVASWEHAAAGHMTPGWQAGAESSSDEPPAWSWRRMQ